jgi:hypothetical protein
MVAAIDALFENGLRPPSVTCAAVLGVLAGSMTLVVSLVVFGALSGPGGAAVWVVLLTWLVALTQVAGAVLLIIGGVRLAVGAGRTSLVAGAALQALVSAVYLVFAHTVVAHDTDEPRATVVAMTGVAIVLAAVPVVSAVLASLPTASEYLRLVAR